MKLLRDITDEQRTAVFRVELVALSESLPDFLLHHFHLFDGEIARSKHQLVDLTVAVYIGD